MQDSNDWPPKPENIMQKNAVGIFVVLVLTLSAFWFFFLRGPQGKIISALEGGTIEAYGVKIEIPARALKEDTEILIERVAKSGIVDSYLFLPEDLKFLKPVTISILYKEEGLEGKKPQEIMLTLSSREGEKGAPIKFTVDESEKLLIFKLREF